MALLLGLVLWMSPAMAGDVEKGQSVYAAKCRACHGAEGKGDGPAARALPQKPRDFGDPAFWEGMTDEKLKATIQQGKPGSAMRAFPMKEEQLSDLVAYLRSLAPAPE